MTRLTLGLLAGLLLAACGGATLPVEEPAEDDDEPHTYAVALRLEEAEPTADDTPQTRVVLVKIEPDGARTLEELRVEPGACWHLEGSGEVLIAARCWWAGAGAAYALSREGDAVIARRRDVDEMEAEAGEWIEAGRVELPANAVLQVLAPGRQAELPSDP